MTIPSDAGVPIPPLFHSAYLEGPFQQCIDCETPLLTEEQVYSVHKAYVRHEAVFEMAMCIDCMMKMRQQCSQETALRMQQFIEERLSQHPHFAPPPSNEPDQSASLPPTFSELNEAGSLPPLPADELHFVDDGPLFTWEEALRACHLCGKLRQECHRYEITGILVEDQLIVQPPSRHGFPTPIMICDDCNGQLSELVSKKTRDMWDRFVESHFDGPPGIELDSPTFRPVLL